MDRYTLQDQSRVIDALRFPMTVLVVCIHFNILLYPLVSHGEIIQYDLTWVQYPITLFSEVLGRIAVPFFFLISGYFFFFKEKRFTTEVYVRKIKRRFYTLFIPYIAWWVLTGVIITTLSKLHLCRVLSMKDFLLGIWSIRTDNIFFTTSPCLPLDEPLWFLRDLMVVIILSPIIYQMIRLGRYSVIFLFLLAITFVLFGGYGIPFLYIIPGLSFPCVLFFSIGAYLGWNKLILLNITQHFRKVIIPLSLLLIFLDTILTEYVSPLSQSAHIIKSGFIHNLQILCGLFLVIDIVGLCKNHIDFLLKYSSASFFIFAFHKIIIIPVGYIVVYLLQIGNEISPYCALTLYITIILFVNSLGVISYKVISLNPLMHDILVGGR